MNWELWVGVALLAVLRIAVIWTCEGVYPGLPADFIPVDDFVFGFGALAACVLTLALLARLADRAPLFSSLSAISAWLLAPALVLCPDLVGRKIGDWERLRRALVAYDQTVQKYVRERGPVDTEAEARALTKVHPSPRFSFGASGQDVHIVYRWYWGRHARVLIVWGRGRSAAFDLETMRCDSVD